MWQAISDDVSEEEEAEEIRWRKWVDKTFVQLITVNIYRTVKESWQTFDYITTQGNFNFFEKQAARVSGAGLMYGISGRLIKKYGIEGDLREALYAAANKWTKAVGRSLPYSQRITAHCKEMARQTTYIRLASNEDRTFVIRKLMSNLFCFPLHLFSQKQLSAKACS